MNTILVVEDDAIIGEDIQRTLQRLGYEVGAPQRSGADALRSIEAKVPDLVLMDIRLHGPLDGIQTAAQIRQRWDVPVVYLSAHSDEATIARAKETVPHGYLLKPFNERDLRTTIEVALRKHELELKLSASERWFSTTLDSIGDAVIATDAQERVAYMNPIAERLTGWKEDDAKGRKIVDVFKLVGPDGVALESAVGRAIRQGFRLELPPDTQLVNKQGGTTNVDDSAAPIVDDRGRVLGGVAVFRDVTERKRLEQRIAVSERLAAIGTLTAGVAHEINNPLSASLANVEFALERLTWLRSDIATNGVTRLSVGTLEEATSALFDAERAGQRVRTIVQDLKRFARAEEAERTVLDLPDVLDVAIKLTEHQVKHSARMTRRYGTTPLVEANEGQLVQVVVNLIVNAAQAIGNGAAARHEIVVSTRTDDAGRAEFVVKDSGPGISKQDLAKIFDPFFTTKAIGDGTGLGLSICHSVVASLNGELSVESELGSGAAFKVALPPASAKPEPVQNPSIVPLPGRRGRVLCIDDDQAVLRTVTRVLGERHEVVTDLRAHDALSRIAHGEGFDIIFCDLMMPEMTGVDFYHTIRTANPALAERIVFLTGGAFTKTAAAFLETCANLVVLKPFKVLALRKVVADYVASADQAPAKG
jgi:PAS domain S-box-containing protein